MRPLNLFLIIVIFFPMPLMAATKPANAFTQEDRELLIRLDERLNQIDKRFEQVSRRFQDLREYMNKRFEQVDKRFEQIDKRFEQIDKRFEQVDKRFEQVDKRFEQIDKRFEQVNERFHDIITLMMGIISAFTAIVVLAIGFALWDRRTMIRPFEDKVEKIKEDIIYDRKRINHLIRVLRELAKGDPRLAEVLRGFSLL